MGFMAFYNEICTIFQSATCKQGRYRLNAGGYLKVAIQCVLFSVGFLSPYFLVGKVQ